MLAVVTIGPPDTIPPVVITVPVTLNVSSIRTAPLLLNKLNPNVSILPAKLPDNTVTIPVNCLPLPSTYAPVTLPVVEILPAVMLPV